MSIITRWPNAASEEDAGLIELATQVEVDAGTDNQRAVTPATLASWPGGGGGGAFAFDGANLVLSDEKDGEDYVQCTVELLLDSVPIEASAFVLLYAISGGLPFQDIVTVSGEDFAIPLTSGYVAGNLLAIVYPGSSISVTFQANVGTYQIAVVLPSGAIVLSNEIAFEEPPPP